MSDVTPQLREAIRTIQALRARVAALQADRAPPIAVVGMSCRLAGAEDPAALWELLAAGRDAVRRVPPDRWDAEAWFAADPDAPGRIAFREGGFLPDVDGFDHTLFGIAAREAEGMDPQHRLLLELAWAALEDAAIRPDGLGGSATGVFLGVNGGDHALAVLGAPERVGTHALAGAVGSIAAGRIAYALGLTGPAMVVDTACSSSLVAVHLAVQALRRGECGMALAGGVHLMLAPNVSVALSRARMMAPDGRCKAFDAAADGFGQGEGGGLVVLKRLADAEAAGDRILAVIAGSALNQDGRSAGITAPNQRAQEAVIRAALADAGVAPDAVDAIEAHGTGTALGDPLELHALAAVHRGRTRPLPVGSVKTTIGHTAAAAGVAGLIKAVLMLRHQAVPPVVHFRRLNPHVSLEGVPVTVPTALEAASLDCVGVSSFGFSGTNAHVVLRAGPPVSPPAAAAPSASWPGLPRPSTTSPHAAPPSASWPGLSRPSTTSLHEAPQVVDGPPSPAMTQGRDGRPSPAMTQGRAPTTMGPTTTQDTVPTLLLSARTPEDLAALVAAYRSRFAAGLSFADACHTAWRGRPRFAWWVAVTDPDQLATAIPRQGPPPEAEPPPARIADLPRTIFTRRHFPRVTVASSDVTGFPGRVLDTPSADRQLECVLDRARLPWLEDHQVQGRVIVPGAVMIAVMLAIAPGPALARIRFVEPVVLEDGAIRLVALARPDGSVSVTSRDGAGWITHATAQAEPEAGMSAGAPTARASPAPFGAPMLDRPAWIAHLAALGITIGPSFQAITRLSPGPRSVATLDDSVLPEPVGGPFHPALLDAVLQVAGGTLPAEPVLPIGIDRLALHAPLRGALEVVAERDGEAIGLQVTSDGRPVATIEGLRVQRLAESLPPRIAALTWRAAPRAEDGDVDDRASVSLAPASREVVDGRPSPAMTRGGVPPTMTRGGGAGASSALAAAAPHAGPAVFHVAPDGANLGEALALLRQAIPASRPVAFVTRGATPPVSDPGSAAFLGLASALAAEHPDRGIRAIDLALGTPDAALDAELARPDADPVVALRPEGRFVPRLVPAPPARGTLRLSGTVLITGGFGGIGRHTAAWAAARGAEAILLVGRTRGDLPAGLPGNVPAHAVACDIGAPDALPALRAALAPLPPLRTVIHAAGVLRDGLIEHLTPEDFARVLAPKLAGARTLHALTRDLPLDHFLLFGSVASLIGAAGQANYAAANAALDAFAGWRRAQGLPATSIAWGRWAGTGMAATLSDAQSARVSARGLPAMPPDRALAALDAAELSGEAVVMVAALDPVRLAAAAPPVFADLLPAAAEPDAPLPEQVAALVAQILGQPAAPGQPLVACGLDSLMAMDLRNRLNRRFGLALGLADLMGGADLDALIAAVEQAGGTEVEEMVL
ncbi:MAG: SDR family NAD(P)-dependent oxidoreductase [Rhodospirillales bacterium]|nr:SDR family NAD(P)-dependent oxidoreductase [Rhodospirillales bacterium]